MPDTTVKVSSRNEPGQSIVHLLHRAGQCADSLTQRSFAESNLTTRQALVLLAVSNSTGPLSQTDLVAASGIDRSTIADIVRRLVDRGFLGRKRTAHDARMYSVELTAMGRRTAARLASIRDSCEAELLAAIPRSERRTFVNCLEAIVTAFGPIRSARVASRRYE